MPAGAGDLRLRLRLLPDLDVKHNRHHAHPNTEGADPDITISVLAFSGSRTRASRDVQRLAFRYQAWLLVPMLFLEAFSLHAASIRAMTRRSCRNRAWEAALLGMHAVGYLTAIFLVLPPELPDRAPPVPVHAAS